MFENESAIAVQPLDVAAMATSARHESRRIAVVFSTKGTGRRADSEFNIDGIGADTRLRRSAPISRSAAAASVHQMHQRAASRSALTFFTAQLAWQREPSGAAVFLAADQRFLRCAPACRSVPNA